MFFEHIFWEEEYLGLVSGVSFVLMGVFAYFVYYLSPSPMIVGFIAASLSFSGLTSILLQIYRVRKIKPGISTFLGGISMGVAVIFWALVSAFSRGEMLRRVEIASLSAALTVLSFFAFGFLFLALYPARKYPFQEMQRKHEDRVPEKKKSEKSDIDELLERL